MLTSVPLSALLRMVNLPPMISSRSCIPRRPKCPLFLGFFHIESDPIIRNGCAHFTALKINHHGNLLGLRMFFNIGDTFLDHLPESQ